MASVRAISEKSEELQIPFMQVLAADLTETILQRVYIFDEPKSFLLCNERELGLSQVKERANLELQYVYTGSLSALDCLKILQKDLVSHLKQEDYLCHDSEVTADDRKGKLWLGIYLKERYIPFTIHLQKEEGAHLFPREEAIRLIMDNNKSLHLPCYPAEQHLAKCLAQILLQLELLGDMSAYDKAYDIIRKYSLEGRRVMEAFSQSIGEDGSGIKEATITLWKTYGSYHYMKKKWKAYLRGQRESGPSWEEVFQTVEAFVLPVCDAYLKDEIFFSDWMPELQRFLD